MRLARPPKLGRLAAGGFSLVELLVVIGIIGILAAVSIPAIARYLRTYKLQGAAQQVANEIANARGKAISKSPNHGVLFIVLAPGAVGNATSDVGFRYVLEDDVNGGAGTTAPTATNTLLANPAQLGPLHSLPQGISFVDATAGAMNDSGLRFNRLGAMCDPGTAGCQDLGQADNYVHIDAGGAQAMVTLQDARTGLKSQVTVLQGGRISITNSWTVK